MSGFTPGKTAYTRVHIIEGRARPDHEPDFQSCLKAQAFSKSFGDIERIECPDPNRFGSFIEVGQIQGADERGTMDLMGRYAADLASDLLRIAKKRCANDVHVNFGACTDPRQNNKFTKKLILEDARLTNYNTEDLGALSSGENAVINETTSLSIADIFEVLQLSFSKKAEDVVLNPIVDIVICDRVSCGDCDEESDGCEKIYSLNLASVGSPGTAPDIIYSLDKGQTWALNEINSMLSSEDGNALACVDGYVVVVSEDTESHHYKSQADIDAGVIGGWLEATTGYVATKGPLDIWSVGNFAFVVGEGGYVYAMTDPTAGVTVLDAGVATTEGLNCVHALSDELAIAGGDNDIILYTKDQTTWNVATATGGGNNILCCWMKNADEWWVGDDAGNVYYSLDAGVTWTEKTLPGVGWTAIYDISFASKSVGYMSAKKGVRGYLLRTYDGGYSWVVLPEGAGSLPLSVGFTAIASCPDDVNFLVAGGLDDVGTGGSILVGKI